MLKTDILVIGSGVAGLSAAIYLAESGYDVIIITKNSDPSESNTKYAQGGIVYKTDPDLREDIFISGQYLNNPEAIDTLLMNGEDTVSDLLLKKAQIKFDKQGSLLDFIEEAAHRKKRIIHTKDTTGKSIEIGLLNYIKWYDNVHLLTDNIAVDILTREHHTADKLAVYGQPETIGAYVLDLKSEEVKTIFAQAVIIASGGMGRIYKHSTNPDSATGDGYAMAKRAGASLINMEYTQFHPTTMFNPIAKSFLITEAIRGAGGKLKNIKGELFMSKYHKQSSLAPRDIVSRAIHEEMLITNSEYVLLDVASYMSADKIKNRFPGIYNKCIEYKIDITKEPIPVVPAFHFQCGGIKCSKWGRTSIKNLFACGETACTGLHGGNRLASTSMLEGVVWGRQICRYINEKQLITKNPVIPNIFEWKPIGNTEIDPALIRQDWENIRNIMWNYVGLIRSTKRLKRALSDALHLNHQIEEFYQNYKLNRDIIELRNGVQTAIHVINAAWKNKKSIGCHYRID